MPPEKLISIENQLALPNQKRMNIEEHKATTKRDAKKRKEEEYLAVNEDVGAFLEDDLGSSFHHQNPLCFALSFHEI